jgi:acetyl esterase/lipase
MSAGVAFAALHLPPEAIMRRALLRALGGLAVLLAVPPGRALAESGAATVEKAIKAHGGRERLARLRTFRATGRGTLALGGADVPCTMEVVSQFPDRYRITADFEAGGRTLTLVQVLDGDDGWAWANGKTEALAGKKLDELKAQLHVYRALRLTPLLDDRNCRLTPLPGGVAVNCKGQRSLALYFDKDTGLLAKVERLAFDDSAKKDVLQEELFSEYRDVGGVQTAMKRVWRRGGKKVLEVAFTEVSYPTHVSARELALPDAVEAALRGSRHLFTHTPEVIYGRKAGMALTMDVFAPKKGANGAAVILVVSGGWFSDREIQAPFYAPFIPELVKRGYTVFTVGHGSQPTFTIPDAIADVDRSVRFIRARARDFGIDPNRIGITGGSAGGHLSLMQGVAGRPGDPKGKGPVERASSRVQAVACFFPPTDFLNYGSEGHKAFAPDGLLAAFRAVVDVREISPRTKRLERISDEKALDLARTISPITHVNASTAPTLIIHGDADKLVPIQQAEVFVARLKKAGVASRLVVRKGKGHGWPGMHTDGTIVADWFDRYLKKEEAPTPRERPSP